MVNDIFLVIEERMPEQNARFNLRRAHEPYEMCAIGQNAGGEKRIQQEYAKTGLESCRRKVCPPFFENLI